MKSRFVSTLKSCNKAKPAFLILMLWAAVVLVPNLAPARIFIDINAPAVQKLQIAVPAFSTRASGAAEPGFGGKLADIVANDLEISGYFVSIEEDAFLPGAVKDVARDAIRFKDWSLIGAELLLACTYNAIGQSLELEVRLYDVFRARRVYTKRLLGKRNDHRTLAHRLSNEIIYLLTGQKGMFLSRLAYVNRLQGKENVYKEIFTCDVDGHNAEQLTFDKGLSILPRWSPDGKKLLYVSYKDGGPMLYLKELGTGVDRRISARKGLNIGANWAPDGRQIALTLSHGDNPDIYTIDLKGNILDRLTRHWGIDVSPVYSPDGRKMAFVSNRSGSPQIYIRDLQNGEERRLTFEGKYNTSPTWSSLNRIAFSGMDGGRFDIYTINADGTGLQNLTQGGGNNEDPCWSPDGRYLAFSSNREGGYHLYLMTAGGRNQTRISFQEGEQTSPSWSHY
ncbi:MAG: Tol-Pal system beta propeller repeat protein TolB [Deltaproteobacteria bacterium]|nr:Tol-Pal system beta propeller repeat protein TolB [Deltaproteobacteria bacterium]